MAERIVNSIVFVVEDDTLTNLVLQRISTYGNRNIDISNNIYYYSDRNFRFDLLSKPGQVVISLNLDFSKLLDKSKYKEASLVSPSFDDKYLQYYEKVNLIGFQRHLLANEVLTGIDINSKDNFSLGLISSEISIVEPVFRKSDLVNLNLASIKYGDLPVSLLNNVTGFTSEQFIQLAKYAGYSDKLKVLNFEFRNDDKPHLTADVIATAIWYFVESISASIESDNVLESIVLAFEETDKYITLERNLSSTKCYFIIEGKSEKYPCTNEDFILAKEKGEFSNQILKVLRTSS